MEGPTWNIFDQVLDLSPAERERYYQKHNISPHHRQQIQVLLAHEAAAEDFLGDGVSKAIDNTIDDIEAKHRPDKCGSFQPTTLLGRGGMGSVWLADRTDGEVRQQVAIKILRNDLESERIRERFLQERQILAGLVHPNIARLLDAGHTDDSRPFLALEYVQGEPIDVWSSRLSLANKLRLFCKVCNAVSYAHRNLIIHRDLKPSNILVAADGEPKLLDFGIAKLTTLSTEQTLTVERFLTPDYASPEQVTGEITGTATDIYSLGAILYKILTGRSPHDFQGEERRSIATAICRSIPEFPSRLNPDLKGDLDFILMKALRKEPEERYISADQFREDIERYLDSRPIRARTGDLLYRGRRFLRRNWLAAAASTAVIASLIFGYVTADSQRRSAAQQRNIAENERTIAESRRAEALAQREEAEKARIVAAQQEAIARAERTEAENQRAAAENRFNQVRQLANRLLDVDRDIRTLAGSTKARQSLVNTALDYLGKLEADAANDTKFQLELANAYRQVARIQAEPGAPNLAQVEEGNHNLKKEQALLYSVLKREPSNLHATERLIESISTQAKVLGGGQLWDRAMKELERAFPLLRSLPESERNELPVLRLSADLNYVALGVYLNLDKIPTSLEYGRRNIDIRRQIMARSNAPGDRRDFAVALINFAASSRFAGNLEEALAAVQEGRQIMEKKYDPASTNWQDARDLRYALYHEGNVLGAAEGVSLGRFDRASETFQRVRELAKRIREADPKDIGINAQSAAVCYELGLLRLHSHDPQSALAFFQEALQYRSVLPPNHANRRDQFHEMAAAVRALVALNRMDEASKLSERLFQEMTQAKVFPEAAGPRSFAADAQVAKAELLLAQGRREEAIQTLQTVSTEMAAGRPDLTDDLHWSLAVSEIYQRLAEFNQAAGKSTEAQQWAEKRRSLWAGWDRKLPANPFVTNQLTLARMK